MSKHSGLHPHVRVARRAPASGPNAVHSSLRQRNLVATPTMKLLHFDTLDEHLALPFAVPNALQVTVV